MDRQFEETELTLTVVKALKWASGKISEDLKAGRSVAMSTDLKQFQDLLKNIQDEKLDIRLVSREY